ncbi:hypothetical protein N7495_001065 [Penicillium taxi]|uniref:uncharacterized protein n=1 Tax=Penicillium taxi TaxID=168475 RepID=UPI0025457766|nr:uncharacterized protein N7495_001065 [Penicillium taxi]KAJ5908383.1 hypothetical protein N7495_001065 [Penicillium taxi]
MDPNETAEESSTQASSSQATSPHQRHAEASSASRPPLAVLRPRAPSASSASRARRPSIRLTRLPSTSSLNVLDSQVNQASRPLDIRSPVQEEDESWQGNRRRSNSEPRPSRYSAPIAVPPAQDGPRVANPIQMSVLSEESSNPNLPPSDQAPDGSAPTLQPNPRRGMLRRTSQAALGRFTRNRASTVSGPPVALTAQNGQPSNEIGSHVVDVLDVIDPEVSALSTLNNVQNSLFVPNLGNWINRMPTYALTRPQSDEEQGSSTDEGEAGREDNRPELQERPALDQRLSNISSLSQVVTDGPRYAVLPDGQELQGWTREELAELNDHVRHMLHSRRSKFKRTMRGFGKYVRKPLGFLVTLYATLITLFGLAWVLFLIGWINVAGKQSYLINVIDNVLVALFAIMGDGLAPFRAVDTYHMAYIAHYSFKTWKIRQSRQLPDLKDKNDIPEQRVDGDDDIEVEKEIAGEEFEYSVLSPEEQSKLQHHQAKFAKSHTFYKPHETFTHHAFPLRMLVAIVVILDCHSLLQMALGACTWSMEPPKYRPFALTTVILCCSITCNITGGILIMIGDRMARKTDVVERIARQQLTAEAMHKMEKRKLKEERRSLQLERPETHPST